MTRRRNWILTKDLHLAMSQPQFVRVQSVKRRSNVRCLATLPLVPRHVRRGWCTGRRSIEGCIVIVVGGSAGRRTVRLRCTLLSIWTRLLPVRACLWIPIIIPLIVICRLIVLVCHRNGLSGLLCKSSSTSTRSCDGEEDDHKYDGDSDRDADTNPRTVPETRVAGVASEITVAVV